MTMLLLGMVCPGIAHAQALATAATGSGTACEALAGMAVPDASILSASRVEAGRGSITVAFSDLAPKIKAFSVATWVCNSAFRASRSRTIRASSAGSAGSGSEGQPCLGSYREDPSKTQTNQRF